MKSDELKARLSKACSWITDIAQVKDEAMLPGEIRLHAHHQWTGAIRGEYSGSDRQWGYFCPIWHTGQAVKALVMASSILGDELLVAAKAGADFIVDNTVCDGDDAGLILAYEDDFEFVNTSAILECLDGLFMLSEKTGIAHYRETALNALNWVAESAYRPGLGLFRDCYDPKNHCILTERYKTEGRPLLDDAVFLKGFRLTGDERFRKIALETADRLLGNEDPLGNWIGYAPCMRSVGSIHPRHAFWWGRPMLDVFRETQDQRYLDVFKRSVQWYVKALRHDGGLFRATFVDFTTDSFGHATSGVACAALMFEDYLELTEDPNIEPHLERALEFCTKMQFMNPSDSNLSGCILEKVKPPDGTDSSPYHIRDLGTIFFVQAVSTAILRLEKVKDEFSGL